MTIAIISLFIITFVQAVIIGNLSRKLDNQAVVISVLLNESKSLNIQHLLASVSKKESEDE